MSNFLKLAFGFSFEDLYDRDGIVRLDDAFLKHLEAADALLAAQLKKARAHPAGLERKAHSELVIALAP